MAAKSDLTKSYMPPVHDGVPAVEFVAALVLYTMQHPFPVFRLVTEPLNVSGGRDLSNFVSLRPYMKLLAIAIDLVPRTCPYWFTGKDLLRCPSVHWLDLAHRRPTVSWPWLGRWKCLHKTTSNKSSRQVFALRRWAFYEAYPSPLARLPPVVNVPVVRTGAPNLKYERVGEHLVLRQ